jgi:cyclase
VKGERRQGGTAVRIIPCLDVRGGRVVKGVRFGNLVDSGDPAELSARYEAEGADEIAMLDISATLEERRTATATVERIRRAVSIPVLVGGGIRSVEDAQRLLGAGADRVSVNSAAVADPGLISRLAERFGVQCVVLAVDAGKKLLPGPGITGSIRMPEGHTGLPAGGLWEVFIHSGGKPTGIDPVAWCAKGEELGAGEILLTAIDRDGTGSGYDVELLRLVSRACGISVIASGGAARPDQFYEGIEAGAGALLAAGVFHRGELSVGELKRYLASRNVEVRI